MLRWQLLTKLHKYWVVITQNAHSPMGLNFLEQTLILVIFEGIFYGLYCVILGSYLRIQVKRRDGFNGILVYAMTLNFIMCTAFLAVDMSFLLQLLPNSCRSSPEPSTTSLGYLILGANSLYVCIDLISQGILIYRCWVLWHRSLIVVFPLILSFGFLSISLATLVIIGGKVVGASVPTWYNPATTSTLFISLAVNALVTGLIVFRMVVELKARNIYRPRGGSRDIYLSISILVESGMITFVAQLVQIILYMLQVADGSDQIFPANGLVTMLFGISPTLVLVRVVMGLTYDTEVSGITTSHVIQFSGVESSNNHTVQMTTLNNP